MSRLRSYLSWKRDGGDVSGEHSVFGAMAVAVTVAPAVACLEVILLVLAAALLLEPPTIGEMAKVMTIVPGALILAYLFGLVPAVLGALVVYPVIRLRLPSLLEYIAAAVAGGVVVELAMSGFNPAGLLRPSGFAAAGILPAVVSLHVFRRRIRRPSVDRSAVTWKRRQPL